MLELIGAAHSMKLECAHRAKQGPRTYSCQSENVIDAADAVSCPHAARPSKEEDNFRFVVALNSYVPYTLPCMDTPPLRSADNVVKGRRY